jgi:hypothetical protein
MTIRCVFSLVGTFIIIIIIIIIIWISDLRESMEYIFFSFFRTLS